MYNNNNNNKYQVLISIYNIYVNNYSYNKYLYIKYDEH